MSVVVTDHSLIRIGAVAKITGALLLLVAMLMHPMRADPNDAAAAFQEYAGEELWVTTHLGQFFGGVLMGVGLVATSQTLVKSQAAGLARLGLVGAVVTIGLIAVLQAVDGIALKAVVDAWAAAPPSEKATAFHAAFAVREIEVGIASLLGLVFGVTMCLYGMAIALTDLYPSWLGWLAVLAGLLTAAGGLLMAYTGFSRLAMSVSMSSSSLVIVWFIIMGILMWRRAAVIGP